MIGITDLIQESEVRRSEEQYTSLISEGTYEDVEPPDNHNDPHGLVPLADQPMKTSPVECFTASPHDSQQEPPVYAGIQNKKDAGSFESIPPGVSLRPLPSDSQVDVIIFFHSFYCNIIQFS